MICCIFLRFFTREQEAGSCGGGATWVRDGGRGGVVLRFSLEGVFGFYVSFKAHFGNYTAVFSLW